MTDKEVLRLLEELEKRALVLKARGVYTEGALKDVFRPYITRRDYDSFSIEVSLEHRTIAADTWEESYHNGSAYDHQEETIPWSTWDKVEGGLKQVLAKRIKDEIRKDEEARLERKARAFVDALLSDNTEL